MKVGILALQGAFAEHDECLRRLGAEPVLIRLPEEVEQVDGLIIPGGESTTIGKLMERFGFFPRLREMALSGFPIYGTCAGMILLAKDLENNGNLGNRKRIGIMDMVVRRNAFGRQLDSFEQYLSIPVIGKESFRAVFIRAPLILNVIETVRILARLPDGGIVAAEQGNLLVTAFHPELTNDLRIHEYFLRKQRLRIERA